MYTEDIKERLFVEVCNASRYRKMLQNVVHEPWEDLAVVYRMSGYDGGLITKEQLKQWGISHETLKADAWANTMKKRPPVMVELEDMIFDNFRRNYLDDEVKVVKGLSPFLDLYVLTNEMEHGAVYMLNAETMKKVAEKLGSNLIILPSSTDDVIIMTEEADTSVERCREIVKEVNENFVAEKYLSDSVYRYEKDRNTLSIMPEGQMREQILPDKITMEEMYKYGYTWEGMLPLSKERALELEEAGLQIFRLSSDGGEGMISGKEDIHAHDGLFGVEKQDWRTYLSEQKNTEAEGMVPKMG